MCGTAFSRPFNAHLGFRGGLQVAQTVAQSLSGQAELAMLLLDGGDALEHHFIILPGETGKTGVQIVLSGYTNVFRVCALLRQ